MRSRTIGKASSGSFASNARRTSVCSVGVASANRRPTQFLRQLVDRVDPIQEHPAQTRCQEDRGVDVLRGADLASGRPLTPGRDQRAHPGAEHRGAVRIEHGKSALDPDRHVGAADFLAVVDPGAPGASDLVLLFPPVVGQIRYAPRGVESRLIPCAISRARPTSARGAPGGNHAPRQGSAAAARGLGRVDDAEHGQRLLRAGPVVADRRREDGVGQPLYAPPQLLASSMRPARQASIIRTCSRVMIAPKPISAPCAPRTNDSKMKLSLPVSSVIGRGNSSSTRIRSRNGARRTTPP